MLQGRPAGIGIWLTDTQPEWMGKGNCAGTDWRLFFPERGETPNPARACCSGCPVKAPCLEYALVNNEKYGIWGGKTESERRKIKRQRAGRAALKVITE